MRDLGDRLPELPSREAIARTLRALNVVLLSTLVVLTVNLGIHSGG